MLGCEPAWRSHPRAPVVLISIDTLRADRLPAWGHRDVVTPAIDRLAQEGILFEEAWAQVPLTLPSHVSLLTSQLPPITGVRDNLGYRFEPSRQVSLPQLLAARGYATGGAVSAYVLRGETGLAGAFEFFDGTFRPDPSATLGELQRPGSETVAQALRFLDRVAGRPFFLFLHLFEPHSPYTPPEPFKSRFRDPYDGEIAAADAAVDGLLSELRRRGLYDGAVVVLLSDHGEGLQDHGEREHGVLLYRESLHVPLIVKLPGGRPAGRRIGTPVALVDVLPTILEAVGADRPPEIAGQSLLPLLWAGRTGERPIYSETLYPRLHFGWSELRSVRAGRFHLIDGPDPELYDIASDPRERINLRDARRRAFADLRAELLEIPLRLERPRVEDADALARLAALGYLGAPAGAADGPLPDPKLNLSALEEATRVLELARGGRLVEAAELCRRLLSEHPQLTDVRAQYAAVLDRLGQPEQALEQYRETIRRAPTMAETFALDVAKVELARGAIGAAEQNARVALEARPLEARALLAATAIARGDSVAAEREARAGLGDPAHPHLPAQIVLAQALVLQGRNEAALAAAQVAADQVAAGAAPPVPGLESTLGDIYARMNRLQEAEAAFRREITRFPTTLSAYLRLAGVLALEQRFAEILPLLEQMVSAVPAESTYLRAADAVARLGNLEAAASFRRRARELAIATGSHAARREPVRSPGR